MIGLTSLEMYNSFLKTLQDNFKFELYKPSGLLNGENIYETVRNTVNDNLGISDITQDLLDDETIGPIIIEGQRKTYQEKKRANPLINMLHRYKRSIFQDFENFLRTEVDLVEHDIRVILDEYNSSMSLMIFRLVFNGLTEVLLRNLQHKLDGDDNAICIELDDITMKTKMVVRPGIIAIIFDEKSFLILS